MYEFIERICMKTVDHTTQIRSDDVGNQKKNNHNNADDEEYYIAFVYSS